MVNLVFTREKLLTDWGHPCHERDRWFDTCIYLCIYVCVCVVFVYGWLNVFVCVCIHTRIPACIHLYTCVCARACVRACVRVYLCVYVCLYVSMYVEIYVVMMGNACDVCARPYLFTLFPPQVIPGNAIGARART